MTSQGWLTTNSPHLDQPQFHLLFTCRKSPPRLRWSCERLQQRAPVKAWRRHLGQGHPFVPVRWKFTWSELTIGIEGSLLLHIVFIWVPVPNQGKGGLFLWWRFLLCKTDLTSSCLIACTQFGRTIRGYISALTQWLHPQSHLFKMILMHLLSVMMHMKSICIHSCEAVDVQYTCTGH